MHGSPTDRAAPRRNDFVLAPRRAPVQERARRTVDLILETAARLLEEVGVEAFNTNLLAERASVQVRTIYRYFPNKLAIMTAVAERTVEEWDTWFDGFRALGDPNGDWRELWTKYVDGFLDGIRALPGGLAVRRAMRALPELQAVDRRDNERLASQMGRALQRRGVSLPSARLRAAARALIETAVAILDLALVEPRPRAGLLIEELKRMQLGYLESIIEAPPRAGSRHGARNEPNKQR